MTERERKAEADKEHTAPAPVRLDPAPEVPPTGWSPTAWRQGEKKEK